MHLPSAASTHLPPIRTVKVKTSNPHTQLASLVTSFPVDFEELAISDDSDRYLPITSGDSSRRGATTRDTQLARTKPSRHLPPIHTVKGTSTPHSHRESAGDVSLERGQVVLHLFGPAE